MLMFLTIITACICQAPAAVYLKTLLIHSHTLVFGCDCTCDLTVVVSQKTIFVGCCPQSNIDDIIDFVKTFFSRCFTLRLLQVKFKVLDCPFATMFIVVISCLLSDRDVSQMDKHVLLFIRIVTVLFDAKPCETQIIQIHF